jgi:hypothetical protein
MMDTVRDPLISGDQNGYGQVAHLRQGVAHPELNMLWVAATGSITTPFIPYWIGVDKVLRESSAAAPRVRFGLPQIGHSDLVRTDALGGSVGRPISIQKAVSCLHAREQGLSEFQSVERTLVAIVGEHAASHVWLVHVEERRRGHLNSPRLLNALVLEGIVGL